MRAHLEHRAGAGAAGLGMAEAGIEETGIVDAELADQRIVGQHLRGMIRRHHHRLLGGEDVEIVGIEHQRALAPGGNRLPEVERVVMGDLLDVDQPGVVARLVADDAGAGIAREVDREGDAAMAHHRLAGGGPDQLVLLLQLAQRRVAAARRAAAHAKLNQPRAGAHQDAEGARRDLGIERPLIALAHPVELRPVIGDQAGEDVEPPGRALGVGDRRGALAQRQMLDQRDDVDAAALQHRAVRQVDAVHRQVLELLHHRGVGPGQEAGAHPIRDLAEA